MLLLLSMHGGYITGGYSVSIAYNYYEFLHFVHNLANSFINTYMDTVGPACEDLHCCLYLQANELLGVHHQYLLPYNDS